MKQNNNSFRTFFILLILGLSVWSLLPTFQVHSLQGEEKEQFVEKFPRTAKKAVNFGLDLAGGTHVVVEIDTAAIKKAKDREGVLDRSLEIIRNRVDKFGVSEPVIMSSGKNRIVADLAGVDADGARTLIGGTAKLEFKIVAAQERFIKVYQDIDEYVKSRTAYDLDSTGTDTTSVKKEESAEDVLSNLDIGGTAGKTDEAPATDSASAEGTEVTSDNVWDEIKKIGFTGLLQPSPQGVIVVKDQDLFKVKTILEDKTVLSKIPFDLEFAWGMGTDEVEGQKVKRLYLLKKRYEMDGREIDNATANRVSDGMSVGEVSVDLQFKGLGPKKFATVTGNNIGRKMAIVLDGQVISAPVIQTKIANGRAQITGLDDMNEAKQLSIVLKAGALPAPMEIIELRSVGATLGQENIESGLSSAVYGMALVVLFMIFYYAGAGLNAIIAVVFNVVIIGGVMSMFNATLTLPGLAGVLLTIGMAVDANVIILERIREELAAGKTVRTAISAGYEKAFSTIMDANITTFLTAFILYNIGAGPIKGFGLTMMIGILASLFTSLFVTRYIFDLTMKSNDSTKMSIGKDFSFIRNLNLQIIPKRHISAVLSGVVIIASVAILAIHGLNYGIDFTGGNVITVELDQNGVTANQVSTALNSEDVLKGSIVRPVESPSGKTHYLISIKNESKGIRIDSLILSSLSAANLTSEVINEEMVGPAIGKELKEDALWAICLSLLIIIFYIWMRFGKNGLGFGLASVVALTHDVIITLGVFAIMDFSVDATTIAAVLTIVGYSLNDTIVVFDRVRENTQLLGKDSFDSRVNLSINQSLSRTIITSITTLFVVVVMAFVGGPAVQQFAYALIIGVIVGTYSSVFVASPFVVWWSKRYSLKIK
ncbi:MAG: protein translocase subunit SecD [Fibrobacterales bacterium]